MIIPNKITRYNESIMPKLTAVLNIVSERDINLIELYTRTKKNFEDIDQFILTIDSLYVLDKINFDEKTGAVSYVDADKL